jgi:epoxyqueuosine reductase
MNDDFNQRTTTNEQRIKELALQLGFDDCGISQADHLFEQEEHLNKWLNQGYNGEMSFFERNSDKRFDPRILVPNAKSVISVLLHYNPGNPDISTKAPMISRHAICPDYHRVVKDKLHALLSLIRKEFGKVEGRAFVDSAPVLEKTWAARAGLGWIGKNSLLISPSFGTFVFIGELIIDLELKAATERIEDKCGSCNRCIDACPNSAIVSPRVINTTKCIAYLTIEKEAPLTKEDKESLNGWCYGCDICQVVCPWNGKVSFAKCNDIKPKQEVIEIDSGIIKTISKEKFESIFNDTPIKRIGYEKLIGNANS